MSGIYKSRLFNFLNRQKIRFSNQLGITLRHLQLAAETGVQILLYPVYMIARTSISVRQQLESNSQSSSQSSATNIGISREKISTVDELWLEEKNDNLKIGTHRIDSLTTSATNQKVNSRLSLPRQDNSDDSKTTTSIRFFQKILNWVKTSSVATRLNLFGEASIVYSSNISTTESSEQKSFNIQVLIQRAIAYFFGNKQTLISGKNQKNLPSTESPESGIIKSSQIISPIIKSPETKESQFSLVSQVSSWLEKVKTNIFHSHSLTTESAEQESFIIQILIQRAIAYFFGHKQIKIYQNINSNYVTSLPFSTFSLPVESKTLSFTLPFYSWNFKFPSCPKQDLYLSDNALTQDNGLSVIEPSLLEIKTISINTDWRKLLTINQFSSEIIQDSSCLIVTANFPPTGIIGQNSLAVTPDYNNTLFSNIPLEFSSDLWEAEVITVGYAKNILERILEFLDKITWWIEKQFLKLWQFFQKISR